MLHIKHTINTPIDFFEFVQAKDCGFFEMFTNKPAEILWSLLTFWFPFRKASSFSLPTARINSP